MSPEILFLLVVIVMAIGAGPFYMRMLARGPKPAPWWRGRRDGALIVGVALLIGAAVFSLIGSLGAITFAWLLLVSAAFNLSIAAYCRRALRRLASPGDGA